MTLALDSKFIKRYIIWKLINGSACRIDHIIFISLIYAKLGQHFWISQTFFDYSATQTPQSSLFLLSFENLFTFNFTVTP